MYDRTRLDDVKNARTMRAFGSNSTGSRIRSIGRSRARPRSCRKIKSGNTVAPLPEDDVEHHYTAFVSDQSGNVYEMDGVKQGPLKTDVTLKEGEDLLGENGQKLIKAFIEREHGRNIGFGLMALVKSE